MALVGDILYRIRGSAQSFTAASEKTKKGLGDIEGQSKKTASSVTQLSKNFGQLSAALGVVAGAVGAVGLTSLIKDTVLTASRTQELGNILLLAGEQAGYTREELKAHEDQLKSLGISTQSARQALIRMIQTNIDLADSERLANAARNLATVAAKDTSETLDNLVQGLVVLRTQNFRNAGAAISLTEAYKQYAETMGIAGRELSEAEKRQAALNAVVNFGEGMSGAYETAMETLSKQVRSYSRYTQEAANATGEFLLPAITKVVVAGGKVLKWYSNLDSETRKVIVTMALFATGLTTVISLLGAVKLVLPLLVGMRAALIGFATAHPILAGLTIAVTAFAAAWITNAGNIRERVNALKVTVERNLGAIAGTIVNVSKIVGAAFEFMAKAAAQPWRIGELWENMERQMESAAAEMSALWKMSSEETAEAWNAAARAVGEAGRKSALDLKQATLEMTEDQKAARDELRDYGIAITKDMVQQLIQLEGEELDAFVQMQKAKVDAKNAATVRQIALEKRIFQAVERARASEAEAALVVEEAILKARHADRLISEEQLNEGLLAISNKRLGTQEDQLKRELELFRNVGQRAIAARRLSDEEYAAGIADLEARIAELRARQLANRIEAEAEMRAEELESTREQVDAKLTLEREVGEATIRNVHARRLFEIGMAFKEEAEAHRRLVQDKQITEEEYQQWYSARLESKRRAEEETYLEMASYSEEWAERVRVVWDELGVEQEEIERRILEKRLESATSFADGIRIASDEFLLQMQNWADVGRQTFHEFSEGAADIVSNEFVNFVSGEMDTWRESTLRLTQSLLAQMAQQLIKLGIQWVLQRTLSTSAGSAATAALAAEQAQVTALTASYYELAVAKKIAGASSGGQVGGGGAAGAATPGAQHGGKIAGYGGGDRHNILVESGEFITRKEAVAYYGPRLFHALNSMNVGRDNLRPYARAQAGGIVGVTPGGGGEGGKQLTVVTVIDQEEMAEYFGSRQYGEVVVNRVSEDVVRKMGGG